MTGTVAILARTGRTPNRNERTTVQQNKRAASPKQDTPIARAKARASVTSERSFFSKKRSGKEDSQELSHRAACLMGEPFTPIPPQSHRKHTALGEIAPRLLVPAVDGESGDSRASAGTKHRSKRPVVLGPHATHVCQSGLDRGGPTATALLANGLHVRGNSAVRLPPAPIISRQRRNRWAGLVERKLPISTSTAADCSKPARPPGWMAYIVTWGC
jgi:hypothetical protein